jgi:hypothetical protein
MGHPVPKEYKYGNMVLQVGEVSDDTVKYDTGSSRLGSVSDCIANCRPVLSSERTPHTDKTATLRQEVISSRKSRSELDTKTY